MVPLAGQGYPMLVEGKDLGPEARDTSLRNDLRSQASLIPPP